MVPTLLWLFGCCLVAFASGVKVQGAGTVFARIYTCLLKWVNVQAAGSNSTPRYCSNWGEGLPFLFTFISQMINTMEQLVPYLVIAGKSTAIYVFIIAAIRLFGKKELAQLSVVDLVFILLISNSVQNAMVGNNTTLQGGIAAALGLFTANYILKFLLRKSARFSRAVQGEKIVLIHDGMILRKGMKEAMMSDDELERAIREHGISSTKEVNLAILEVDGNISVLSNDYTHKTVKNRKKPQLSHNP